MDAVKQAAGSQVHLTALPWTDTYKQYWGEGLLTTPDGKPGVVADYYANGGFGGNPTQVIQGDISLNAPSELDRNAAGTAENSRSADLMQGITRATRQARLGKALVSVVWKAAIHPQATGLHSFVCAVNGSGEVYLDGRRIIDLWLPNW